MIFQISKENLSLEDRDKVECILMGKRLNKMMQILHCSLPHCMRLFKSFLKQNRFNIPSTQITY